MAGCLKARIFVHSHEKCKHKQAITLLPWQNVISAVINVSRYSISVLRPDLFINKWGRLYVLYFVDLQILGSYLGREDLVSPVSLPQDLGLCIGHGLHN